MFRDPIDPEQCPDCANAKGKCHHGVYNLRCKGCRDRMVMSESCKIRREIVYNGLYKYGDLSEWKIEPNCGCTNRCIKRQSRTNAH